MARLDGRDDDQLREVKIIRGFQKWPAGSVLIEFGNTRVLCAASVTEGVPRWRAGSGLGWVTAEYSMLPSATNTRTDRESVKGRIGGRTHEISRLIGRSLRACIDLAALGENTIVIDCDVIQADGGTRTAAITGGYVALADAITWLDAAGRLADPKPLSAAVSAVSVGVVDGRVRIDLPYEEDARAEVDMNVVATHTGTLIEVQGTAEGATFTRSTLDTMLDMALAGCAELTRKQSEALESPYPGELPEPAPAKGDKKGKGAK
ncbi:MAG: ribonuclease PH [Haloechinothrix sp.]